MKILCAANPFSQSGLVKARFPLIRNAIEAQGVDHEFLDITATDFDAQLKERLDAGTADVVLGIGGDGTHWSLINTLKRLTTQVTTPTPYAFCPMGTGNDIAKSLRLRPGVRHIPSVIETAIHGDTQEIDLGESPAGYFADMFSVGMDASVLARREAMNSVVRKRKLLNKVTHGYLVYAFATATSVVRSRRWAAAIQIDGREWFNGSMSGILINNCPVHAGEFTLTPQARPDDGKLDVLVMTNIVGYCWCYFRGWRFWPGLVKNYRSQYLTQAERVVITLTEPAPTQVDGELSEIQTSIAIGIDKAALQVKVPRT